MVLLGAVSRDDLEAFVLKDKRLRRLVKLIRDTPDAGTGDDAIIPVAVNGAAVGTANAAAVAAISADPRFKAAAAASTTAAESYL